MGHLHSNRLTVAPAFYCTQIDIFGPYMMICEHNHRSQVKAYGVVFKDPSTGAINIHTMQIYSTEAFLQAYTRHASRYGHPSKIYIDAGTQLVKACRDMELSEKDIITPNRLILGRNNRRAMTGFARVSTPSRLINQMDQIHRLWWKIWRTEKLEHYVPQSPKWTRTSAQPVIWDIVVFLRTENEAGFGESTWSVGRVLEIEVSADEVTRSALI